MLGFILYVKAITNSFISSTYIFHISSKKKKGLNAILVNQLYSGIDSTAELKPNQFKKKALMLYISVQSKRQLNLVLNRKPIYAIKLNLDKKSEVQISNIKHSRRY